MKQSMVNHLIKMVMNHQGIYETRAYRYWVQDGVLVRVSRRVVGTTRFYGEMEKCGEYVPEKKEVNNPHALPHRVHRHHASY